MKQHPSKRAEFMIGIIFASGHKTGFSKIWKMLRKKEITNLNHCNNIFLICRG